MGSFDCYCAFCSGPLGLGFVVLGSTKAKDIRTRRSGIKVEKRKATGIVIESSEDEEMEDAFEVVEGGEDIMESSLKSSDDDNSDKEDDDFEVSSTSSSSFQDSEFWEDEDSDLGTGDIQDVDIPPSEPEPVREDTWSQASDLSVREDFDLFHNTDEKDKMYKYYEEHSYDPSILKFDELQWTARCRCLAFNAVATGVTKAFISGRGRYDDYGSFNVIKRGRDLNDTGKDCHDCFYSHEPNEEPAFPFHEACYKIFSRNLGFDDEKKVDRDILYSVMKQNVEDYGRVLSLDYGDIQGVNQFWECLPGEEYFVCDPGPRLGFDKTLQSMMPARLFEWAPMSLDLAHKVRNDPLVALPYDILHNIFDHLSIHDAISLMSASWHVLTSTRNTEFWRHLLRRRILPWFWELHSSVTDAALPPTFNHKQLYLWLDRVTTPETSMTGPFMGIANRRRIWAICEQLAPLYKERAYPDEHIEPEDEESESILQGAMSLHMPIVLYPEPKETRTTYTQFIRSWNEIGHSCDLDTYWNADGALIGIAVTFSSVQRIFGSVNGSRGQSLHVSPGDWIQSLTAFVSDVDMLNDRQDRSHYRTAMDVTPAAAAGIRGMSVTLTSGKTKELKSTSWQSKNCRPFLVHPKMSLIGLTGQIAANGVISRIGLLQSYRPGTDIALNSPSYTPAQKMLWAPNAASLPDNSKGWKPIWDHPNYSLHVFPSSNDHLNVPSDMMPHQVLLWAEGTSQHPYQYLKRISCFEVVGGLASSGDRTWEVPDIVGIWPAKTHDYGKAAHIGTGGPVPSQHPDYQNCKNPSELDLHKRFKPFEDANMRHFKINGPGGEVINEVHVSDDVKALKLVTNWGRECYWGEDRRQNWHIKRADEGELILGLSCCFGVLGGWSWGAKMYSHWKLSAVGVVTMKIRDREIVAR